MERAPDAADVLVVTDRDGFRGIAIRGAVRRGGIVCALPRGPAHARPNRWTVQVAADTHVEVGALATLNHSCDPNVALDTSRWVVVALRDLAAGDALSYFYPSTEWDMAEPFACLCGASACLGTIRGARHLGDEVLARYAVNGHVAALRAGPDHP